ncbi:MAG TPA: peptidylprolyl isomerase [Vicinamibacterales bacterium]|nr:peptidylprolyl isomerase [Vicinamibacterales bacterium]
MKAQVVVCMVLLAAAAGACRKQATAQSVAGSTPAAGSAAALQPGAPGQPATAPAKPVPAQLPDVVARVNGEDVKKTELENMIHTMEGRAGQPVPPDRRDEIYRGALDQLIVYKLLSQESKHRGIKIEESEVDAKIQQIRGQFPTQEAFEKAVKDRGKTVDSVRQDARVDLSVNKVMDAEVATVPGPSDADAKDFYDKNPDRFKQDEQVRASHILVRVDPNANAATRQKARAEIESVLKQAKAGGDFAKLAQEHSQDGSAAQGGDLGYFPKGQMVPEFDKVAFSTPKGQLSGIVTTQFGYHLIKVTDRKPARVVPYEEAEQQIKQFLEQQKKQTRADAFIGELKKKAKIEVLI